MTRNAGRPHGKRCAATTVGIKAPVDCKLADQRGPQQRIARQTFQNIGRQFGGVKLVAESV
jgi:hypothetical protein